MAEVLEGFIALKEQRLRLAMDKWRMEMVLQVVREVLQSHLCASYYHSLTGMIFLRYMHKHIRKLMRDMVHRFGIHPVLRLQKEEIIWLGLSAYISVLRKKQSRYTELHSLLRFRIATFEMMGDASELKYEVDDSHSSVFWKLKF